jgi:hypothetical protein
MTKKLAAERRKGIVESAGSRLATVVAGRLWMDDLYTATLAFSL